MAQVGGGGCDHALVRFDRVYRTPLPHPGYLKGDFLVFVLEVRNVATCTFASPFPASDVVEHIFVRSTANTGFASCSGNCEQAGEDMYCPSIVGFGDGVGPGRTVTVDGVIALDTQGVDPRAITSLRQVYFNRTSPAVSGSGPGVPIASFWNAPFTAVAAVNACRRK